MPFQHRLLFQGLWLIADRCGRIEDRPKRIHADIFPFDGDLDVDAMLTDLAQADSGDDQPFIVRYTVNGQRLIEVCKFGKHQRPAASEPDSVLPSRDCADSLTISQTTNKVVAATNIVVAATNKDVREGRREKGEGEGNGRRVVEISSASDDAKPDALMLLPDSPSVLEFPTIGTGPKVWALTARHVTDWQDAYPGVDVFAECKKAKAWICANQPKTSGGMPKFLVNWLNRAANMPRGSPPQAGASKARDTVEAGRASFTRRAAVIQGRGGGGYE